MDPAETPSAEDYKRMKKTMAIMVQFYRSGAEKKAAQAAEAEAELEKLNATLCMCNVQVVPKSATHTLIPCMHA